MKEGVNRPTNNPTQRALGILAHGVALSLLHKFQKLFQCTSSVSKTTQSEMKTPRAFHNKAQGRKAHPGYAAFTHPTPTGLHNGRDLWNPVGVQPCNKMNPGCALRPWALLWNRVAVLFELTALGSGSKQHGRVKACGIGIQ